MSRDRNNHPEQVIRFRSKPSLEASSDSQAQDVTTAASVAGTGLSAPGLAASAHDKNAGKPSSTVTKASVSACKKPLEPWRILCDLYYKGTPWQPEHKKSLPDAASALSQFALRHMLSEHRDCSNTLLWTSEVQMTQVRVKQTFTVYPLIDGPLRTKIQKNYDLPWAIINFTNGPSTTSSTTLHYGDERLMMAIRNIISMGYHVEVWTYLDDDEWDVDLKLAKAELARNEEAHIRTPTRNRRVLLDPQHIQRRRKYDVFVRHGVAGFSQADLDLLDKLQPEQLCRVLVDDDFVILGVGHSHNIEPARLPQSQSQKRTGSELMGFLEHTEETIAEVD